MNKKNISIYMIVHAAAIAAIYVVLTLVFAPISYGVMQIRIAEALTILPLFTPEAVPGLFIGCLIANILGGGVMIDVIFGSLATLLGAVFGYLLRFNRWLVPIPAVLSNTLIIPFILFYGYGVKMSIPVMMGYIAVGEIVGCYVLGEMLATVFLKRFPTLFDDPS